MPDGIALLEADWRRFLLTAEDGDARKWGTDVDVARGRDGFRALLRTTAGVAGDHRVEILEADGARPGSLVVTAR